MQIAQSFKIFLHTVVRSLTDLNFYAEILNSPVRFSLKVVWFFYLLLGIGLSLLFTVKDIPQIRHTFDATRSELVNNYPENLVFDWQGQLLTSNLTAPLEVPFPLVMKPLETAPKNLAIIDTNTDEAPENANALVYLTRSKLFVNSMQGEWTNAELNQLIENDSIHVDKSTIVDAAESSKGVQQQIISILPWLALLFFFTGTFVFRLISTLLNALIVQLLFQLLKKPLSYKKVFQLCLHALIPAELIYQISVLAVPGLNFPMFGLAFWLIISLVIWHLRNLQVVRLTVDKDVPPQRK